jgi:hypothetical protein
MGSVELTVGAPLGPASSPGLDASLSRRKEKTMYEIAEVFEAGKAQDVIKSDVKEGVVDENGQMYRSYEMDDDE